MNFLPILFFCTTFVTYVYSNVMPAGDAEEKLCPPPENIAPCICFKAPITERVTAQCSNFTNAYDIKAIFDKNPNWNLQDVWIDNSVMAFLPAKMLEKAQFQTLNVSSTTLITLFDTTPVTTPELNLYMTDVRLQRGFQWKSIANSTLLELGIWNMSVKSFGQEFKDNVPKKVQRLWFENTGTVSIRNQAFSLLQNLQILVLKRGSLKKISRDMFPRPWNVVYLDLSYQKIADLPEDMFVDLPKLGFFLFEGNMLTTISEKVFIKHKVFYSFNGNPINCDCNIKWVIEKMNPSFLIGKCVEPESLKGTELKTLTPENFRYCH
ncbi:protein slit-like [Argiope bruennichi]|uniref:Oplophorus-luciferin 2-monooxygenase like protein n=1 Tax=Argiope bruennichi TaxID=94029 RepID=A0A8T0E8B4_ARGBR|nr:protein slit-like [Argiope bruennichi]KAF8767983.1 Oplophorus-luciferin 2-monooxygenase like protein [Argiope bruennichi]